MRQFFLATDPAAPPRPGDRVTLDRDESHHLQGVLRGAAARDWCLVDGYGHRFAARAVDGGRRPEYEILTVTVDAREAAGPWLTLACAVVKGRHFDLVVEKAVELGAHRLLPLATSRGVIEPGEGRRSRWEALMRAALKQSGRCCLPELAEPQDLDSALALCAGSALYVGGSPDERPLLAGNSGTSGTPGNAGLADPAPAADRRALFIGPEGGWSPAEAGRLAEAGAQLLDLGPFTLRTETAAIVGLAALRALPRPGAGPRS